MAALGRILQIVGWLWLIGGFIGSLIGFISLNLLPGIILVFVARVIRKQAERTEMPELGDGSVEEQQQEAHQQVARQPAAREPEPREQYPRRSPPEPYVVSVPEEPSRERPQETSQEMLERIVGIERAAPDEGEPVPATETAAVERPRKPLSSAEMIARAHERWDSKDR